MNRRRSFLFLSAALLVLCALCAGCVHSIRSVPRGVDEVILVHTERPGIVVSKLGPTGLTKLSIDHKMVGAIYNGRAGTYVFRLNPKIVEVCVGCGDKWRTAPADAWKRVEFLAVATHSFSDPIRALPSLMLVSEGLCNGGDPMLRRYVRNSDVCDIGLPYTYQEGQLFYSRTLWILIDPVPQDEATARGMFDWYIPFGDASDPRSELIRGETTYSHVMRLKYSRRGY